AEALDEPEGGRSGATMVVIDGARFSTLAESRVHAASGWTPVNMTGAPQAALARELRMCLAAIALVTDMDAGAEQEQGVHQDDVFALFAQNTHRLKSLLAGVISELPDPSGCTCDTWADGIELTYEI